MNTRTLKRPSVRSLLPKKDFGLPTRSPAKEARDALDVLYCQARGDVCLGGLSVPYEPIKGGDSLAIREYAQLICEHVEKLNSLSKSHCNHLRQVSRRRYTWPVLISEHPKLSDDGKELIKQLQVGKGTGRYFDRLSKWSPEGEIAELVDELLYWVYTCKNPPGRVLYCPLGRDLGMAAGMDVVYIKDGQHCPNPTLANLRKHLTSREKKAAKLLPLTASSIPRWEKFIVSLFQDAFKDEASEEYLRQTFASENLKAKPSHAHEYLIRKVRERLRTFAGIKRR